MDRVDAATRSRIMRAIKGKDTKPELALRASLLAAGVEHCTGGSPCCMHLGRLPGRPDVLLHEPQLVVFVHGCFWHCCRLHFRLPKSRVEAWAAHFAKNRRRDARVRRQLRALGWRTMVVWEHEDMARAAARVARRAARG